MPDFTETQINDSANSLAKDADSGSASKFYEEVASLMDSVKKGNLSPDSFNNILRKAEGRQEATNYCDDISIEQNATTLKMDNGKTAKLDSANLHFIYFGDTAKLYDTNGSRK